MTTLVLIRHGESEGNKLAVFAGHADYQLTELGLEQARATSEYITANYSIDAIYASDLQRAYQTACCMGERMGLAVQADRRLREINGGAWQGKTYAEIIERYPEDYHTWKEHIGKVRCTEGESVEELCSRVMAALTDIATAHEGQVVAVATHATPIRVSQTYIAQGRLDEMEKTPWVSNASVTVYQYENQKWKIAVVGEDGHLSQLKTELPPTA